MSAVDDAFHTRRTPTKLVHVGAVALKVRKASVTRRRRFEQRLAALETPLADWDARHLGGGGFVRIPWAEIKADPARFARFLGEHGALDVADSKGNVFTVRL